MHIQKEALYVAWERVKLGSRAAGVDGLNVDLFAGVMAEQLRQMQLQIRQERYVASHAKGFFLPKKQGGNRLIGIPTVRDRILQRYLLQRIYPALEKQFSDSAFAYRPGYSIYDAVAQMMERYRAGPTWVVKTDIQSFFDTLSWPLLLHQLEALKLNTGLVSLIEQQLKSGVVVNYHFQQMNRGVLQGGVMSGALANLYLSEFDRMCLSAGIPLIRYGDDCIAVCHSLIQANRAISLMQDWIEELYLTLNPEKTKVIGPGEAFTFLGHEFASGELKQRPVIRSAGSSSKPKKSSGPLSTGPPKACSIIKSKVKRIIGNPDDYWSDGMTTLYITEQGAYLRVQQQQFQVFYHKELRCSVPINQVSHVVVFGCCNVSHGAVSLALRRRVPILYLSNNGRYFGRLETSGQARLDYLTQQVQRSTDETFMHRQAESIIAAKMHNARIVLMRLNRRRKIDAVNKAIDAIVALAEKLPTADTLASMLGFEGQGAALYFPAYASLLKGPFEFEKRTRRPPTDPINSLLSLGYTLLSQNVHSMVEAVGLHTHFGHLHTVQPNRPSLVCDLVEEFRAPIVDTLVAYLVNSKIYKPEDFTPPDAKGGVYLHPDGVKRFLKHWEEQLQKNIVHPHTNNKVSYRRCMELQVWEYVSALMGEQDVYQAMRWVR